MSIGKANCLICGAPIEYFEDTQDVTCEICGKQDSGHCVCEDGHYVCDSCHRAKGVDYIMETCETSCSTNPIELAQEMMRNQAIYPNGPEHHSMVGAALLTAYKNAGGDIDLIKSLGELRSRSMQVPGGTCGFWGCCGAAVSAGQFYSIISGSTPMTQEPWAATGHLTSRVIGKLADIGGPRCCKRMSFTAIEETARYVDETTGVKMDLPEKTVCTFMANNAECRKRDCPYFPGSEICYGPLARPIVFIRAEGKPPHLRSRDLCANSYANPVMPGFAARVSFAKTFTQIPACRNLQVEPRLVTCVVGAEACPPHV